MVYAMGSIGFLGLLVWSQRSAFLISDNKVKNTTVGWEGRKLLSTLYSENVNNVTQSAGNIKNRSSETIRGNTYGNYDLFRESPPRGDS